MPNRPDILTAEEARAALESLLAGESLSPESQADVLASHERLREQRDEGMKREADFIKKWAAAQDGLARVTAALEDVRAVFPRGICSECAGFEYEVTEANRIIDAALAAVEEPAE